MIVGGTALAVGGVAYGAKKLLEKKAKTRAFIEAWKKLPGTPAPKGKQAPFGRYFNEFTLKHMEEKRRLTRGPIAQGKKE